MKKQFCAALLLAGLASATAAVAPGAANAATDQTVSVIVAWAGNGRTFETGENAAVFVGALTGPVFVETEQGLVPSGAATCPVMVEIDLATAIQTAQGHCLIENPDGDRIYANVNCSGVFRIGCDGTITLTGGTGAFEGVTGSGAVTVRSERRSFVERRSGVTDEEGAGIMIIEELTYTLP
jgi:hypothetical protein